MNKKSRFSVDDLLEGIIVHHKDYPTHGINCSCMDAYIRDFRRLMKADPGDPEAQRRIDYVIRTAIDSRR